MPQLRVVGVGGVGAAHRLDGAQRAQPDPRRVGAGARLDEDFHEVSGAVTAVVAKKWPQNNKRISYIKI